VDLLGWDNDCEGLMRTIAREEGWKECEAQNDAVQCGAEATGWEATPSASPVSRVDVAEAGIWPTPEELVDAWVAAWPGFPPDHVAVEVSVEVHSDVGDLAEGHSACRSL
jgi:hypothetical protein